MGGPGRPSSGGGAKVEGVNACTKGDGAKQVKPSHRISKQTRKGEWEVGRACEKVYPSQSRHNKKIDKSVFLTFFFLFFFVLHKGFFFAPVFGPWG